MGDVFLACHRCKQPVDPDDPDTVCAVTTVLTTVAGNQVPYDPGDAYFHAACFAAQGGVGWKRKE